MKPPCLAPCIVLIGAMLWLVACAPQVHRVSLVVDGERRVVETQATTVGELLRETGVALGEADVVQPPSYSRVESGMRIAVRRVEERTLTKEVILPYEQRVRRDPTLPQGELRIQQLGRNGVEHQTYLLRFEDGIEVERHLSTTEVVTPAEPEIMVVGTRGGPGAHITGTIVYLADGNGWLIREQSSLKTALTRTGDLDSHVFSLSPDGRWLLFSRRPLGGRAGRGGPLNSLWLLRVDVTNAEPRYLRIDGVLWANWQPGTDTPSFAYSSAERVPTPPGWKAHNNLVLVTLSNEGEITERRELLPPDTRGLYAWWGSSWAWSPTGDQLAWATASGVGVVSLDGRKEPLFRFEPYETGGAWVWTPQPTWRPDGSGFLAVVHVPTSVDASTVQGEDFDLYFIPVRAGATRRIASDVGMWSMPAWSPDGRLSYAQAEDARSSATSRYRILVADSEGRWPRLLFPADDRPGVDVPWLAWSPEGRQLATVWQGDLYLLDPDTENALPLTSEGGASRVQWR